MAQLDARLVQGPDDGRHPRRTALEPDGQLAVLGRPLGAEPGEDLGGDRGVAVDLHHQGGRTDLLLEGPGLALLHDPAVVDDRDAAGELVGLLQVLRGQQDRGAALAVQVADLLPQRHPAHRVEARGRLVEEQHLGLVHERQGQVEPTAHAARVGADPAVGGRRQPHPLEELAAAALGDLGRDAEEHGLEVHELGAGHQRVDGRVLEGHADAPSDLAGVAHDVESGHGGSAARGLQQRGQHPHGGGLPRPVRTEEPEDLAPPDRQVDAVDGDEVAEAALEALGDDDRLAQGRTGRGRRRGRRGRGRRRAVRGRHRRGAQRLATPTGPVRGVGRFLAHGRVLLGRSGAATAGSPRHGP